MCLRCQPARFALHIALMLLVPSAGAGSGEPSTSRVYLPTLIR
jgi:hypothetical protein